MVTSSKSGRTRTLHHTTAKKRTQPPSSSQSTYLPKQQSTTTTLATKRTQQPSSATNNFEIESHPKNHKNPAPTTELIDNGVTNLEVRRTTALDAPTQPLVEDEIIVPSKKKKMNKPQSTSTHHMPLRYK